MIETQTIFPTHAVPAAGPLPRQAHPLELRTPDGDRLVGMHFPPSARSSRTLVLGFAGNAWNSQHAAAYLHDLYPDADVVAFHYRGYRPSTGTPSAKALLADAPLVFDAAVERAKPERVVAVGLSIGSGIAAGLSAERKLDGLILVTPFDSLKAVAADHYPWLPVAMLFRNEIDSASFVARSRVPTAIIAADQDILIPRARTEALRHKVGRLVFDETIRGASHNDIYHRPQFRAAMRKALSAVTAAK